MCWGLVPSWWSKPLKELRLATFNARAETVAEKPLLKDAFKRTRCLIPAIRLLRMAGHARRQATLLLHRA
jgi:putative SOS response-associated peptidase YedK